MTVYRVFVPLLDLVTFLYQSGTNMDFRVMLFTFFLNFQNDTPILELLFSGSVIK